MRERNSSNLQIADIEAPVWFVFQWMLPCFFEFLAHQ
jgi:hypothetical protein